MRHYEQQQLNGLRHIFPELTPTQADTAILFAIGLSRVEIAQQRNVSYSMVNRAIEEIKDRLILTSVTDIRSICQIRLVLSTVRKGRSLTPLK